MTHSHQHDHHALYKILNNSGDSGKTIRKVVLIGLTANIILMAIKLITGIFGHSDALVADGFHSLNDIAADCIILLFTSVAYHKANQKYTYGYGKFETFASLLIGSILIVAAVVIFIEGLHSIIGALHGEVLERPDIWTVIVALIAIVTKELLYRFTSYMGKKTGSTALRANAWHHRSDALATVATLIGVTFAHFLGENWRILDPCASLLISFFILIPAIRIVMPAFQELMERGLKEDITDCVREIVMSFHEIKDIESLKGRKNGHCIIIDLCVRTAPTMTVGDFEKISEDIKGKLSKCLGSDVQIFMEPMA